MLFKGYLLGEWMRGYPVLKRASAHWLSLGVALVLVGASGAIYHGCKSSSFRFNAAPTAGANITIGSVSPNIGTTAGGTNVTITGTGFEVNNTTVDFGTTPGFVTAVTTTQITVTTPPNATAGPVGVTVTTPNNGTITAGAAFTYRVPGVAPALSAISPTSGPESGDTEVTITGLDLNLVTGVTIGGRLLLDTNILDDQTLTGRVDQLDPALGTAPVSVAVVASYTDSGGTPTSVTAAFTYTYTPSVVLEKITPNQGPSAGGTTLTITGRNFQDSGGTDQVSGVEFAGTPAASFTVVSATELSVVTPPFPIAGRTEGAVDVTVKGTGILGESTLRLGYQYGPVFQDPTVNDIVVGTPDLSGVATVANVTTSRIASGDISPTAPEVVAFTLPSGAGSGQISVDGATPIPAAGLPAVPVDLVFTKLDNDDDPDIAVLLRDGRVAVFLDRGAAGTATLFGAVGALDARSISTADFNSDGIFDIVLTRATGAIEIYTSDGAAAPTLTLASPSFSPAIPASTDLIRVVACDPNAPTNLNFQLDVNTFEVSRLPKELRFDVNRDRRADIIALASDGTVFVLTGNGSLAFTTNTFTPVGTVTAFDLATTDFNLDGRIDLLLLHDTGIGVIAGDVPVGQTAPSLNLVNSLGLPSTGGTTKPTALTASDFNFDCREDIVLANVDGGKIGLYLARGGGDFGAPVLYVSHAQVHLPGTEVVDVTFTRSRTVRAVADHTIGTSRGLVRVNRIQGTVFQGTFDTELASLDMGSDPRAVKLGDLNDDGKLDIVVANFSDATIEVRFGIDGDGGFGPAVTFSTNTGPKAIVLADVNPAAGTGIDVIVVNQLGTGAAQDRVTVHLNTDGSGNLQEIGASTPANVAESYLMGGKNPSDVVVADVTGDNRSDIITVNRTSNDVSVLPGIVPVGTVIFGAPTTYAAGNSPAALAVADVGVPERVNPLPSANLAADGQLDILVANSGDGTVTVLYNGFDAATQTYNAAGFEGNFGLGETLELGGTIAPSRLLHNLGTTPTVLPQNRGGTTLIEPIDIAVRDMNGDGVLDIITLDQGTGTVTILHANAGDRVRHPVDFTDLDRFELGNGVTTSEVGNEFNQPFGSGLGVPMPFLVGANGADTRKWFIPSDYRFGASLDTQIGEPTVVLKVGTSPQGLVVTDTNQDGRQDIVVGSFDSSDIKVYINTGSAFQEVGGPAAPTPTTPPPPNVPFFPTVVPTTAAAGETTFSGYDLTSPIPIPFTVPAGGKVFAIAVGFIDSDCIPDIAIVLENDQVRVLQGK